jgi:hypothetical protein
MGTAEQLAAWAAAKALLSRVEIDATPGGEGLLAGEVEIEAGGREGRGLRGRPGARGARAGLGGRPRAARRAARRLRPPYGVLRAVRTAATKPGAFGVPKPVVMSQPDFTGQPGTGPGVTAWPSPL